MTRRRAPGFTLLEVMTVVALVAVMTGLAVSGGMSLVYNARVTGEAEVLASFLRTTGLRAISTGCAHKVRYRGPAFTPTGTPPTARTLQVYRAATCQLDTDGDGLGEAVQLHVQPADLLVSSYELASGVEVSIGATNFSTDTLAGFIVGFQPNGSFVAGSDTNSGSAALAVSDIIVAPSEPGPSRTISLRGGNNVILR